ncbi:MAG: copper resistance protein CopC [Thermomicrobiales bacterium]|nr:copper resistance protein CopC [Thermomicrobiales bacterium]
MSCLLFLGQAAFAHANLVSSDPAAGAALAVFPNELRLTFSEQVDPSLSSIALLRADGTRVSLDETSLDPADPYTLVVRVATPDDQETGVYTVVWGAHSAEDDHSSNGAITFSAGTGVAPDQIGQPASTDSTWGVAGKWLELLGVVLLPGLALFAATERDRSTRSIAVTAGVATLLGLAGSVLSFLARAAALSGEELPHGLGLESARQVLATTWGGGWSIRLLALILILALAAWGQRTGRPIAWRLVFGVGVASMVTTAATGHAASADAAWAARLVDFLHLSGASVWAGGLLGILLAFQPSSDVAADRAWLRRQGNRFVVAVAIVIGAGFASAWWHVDGRRALSQTDYGQTLLVKVAVVAGLLGVAYYNRRVLQAIPVRLVLVPLAVGLELVLVLVVLLLSADLSQTLPATQPLPVNQAPRAIEIAEQAAVGSTLVTLEGILAGDPAEPLVVHVDPATDLQRVIVKSSLVDSATGTTVGDRFDAVPDESEPGRYRFPAGRMGIAGHWTLEITVRRAGVEDDVVAFEVDTSALASSGTALVDDRWRGVRASSHTLLALGLAVVMVVVGLGGLRRITGMELLPSAFLLAASMLIAGGFLISAARSLIPITPNHAASNPVHASADLTYAGELYRLNCLACHGADGRGPGADNPVHLHGTTTDLSRPQAVEQSDGDLHYWIEQGVAGTDMPAFGSALTDEEIWQLVRYVRELQDAARQVDSADE